MSVFRAFETLISELSNQEEWLDADMTFRLYSFCNALYEATLDRGAPGATDQYVRGHDHASFASGFHGGRPIPMGKIYSGFGVNEGPLFTATVPKNVSRFADDGNANRRTNSTPPGNTGVSMIFAYVTEGFSSTGSPPVTTPQIDGYFLLDWDDSGISGSVDVTIENNTIPASSVVSSFDASAEAGMWHYIPQIPALGGNWNEYDIVIENNTNKQSLVVNTMAFVLAETYKADGTDRAFIDPPASTTQLGVFKG